MIGPVKVDYPLSRRSSTCRRETRLLPGSRRIESNRWMLLLPVVLRRCQGGAGVIESRPGLIHRGTHHTAAFEATPVMRLAVPQYVRFG